MKLEEWEQAASDAGEAIARDEKYGKAYALRGQARMTLENYDDACKDYSRASDLEPESKAFKESLAQVRVWLVKVNLGSQRLVRLVLLRMSELWLPCALQAKRLRANEERKSLYDVLNLPRDAAGSQIKKGYHKAALVWHPDKHSDKGPEVRRPSGQQSHPGSLCYPCFWLALLPRPRLSSASSMRSPFLSCAHERRARRWRNIVSKQSARRTRF